MNNKEFVNRTIEGIFGSTEVNFKQAQPIAWEGVEGVNIFNTPTTVSEAAEACGANYTVKKYPMLKISPELAKAIRDGEPITDAFFRKEDLIETHMTTVREDKGTILGVVGESYGVVQNTTSMNFFNHILNGDVSDTQKASIKTAGILDGGARFFITAKMDEDIHLEGDNSPINDYILLTNSHDGSGSVTVLFTPIRVVCRNTLNAALRHAKSKLIYKHTSLVNERIDLTREANIKRAMEVLKLHENYVNAFIEDANALRNVKLTHQQVQDMVCKLFADEKEMAHIQANLYNLDSLETEKLSSRKKNLIISAMDAIESGVGQDVNRGTGLWLYNGIATWAQNGKNYRDAQYKFDSIIDGDINRKMNKIHSLILN